MIWGYHLYFRKHPYIYIYTHKLDDDDDDDEDGNDDDDDDEDEDDGWWMMVSFNYWMIFATCFETQKMVNVQCPPKNTSPVFLDFCFVLF